MSEASPCSAPGCAASEPVTSSLHEVCAGIDASLPPASVCLALRKSCRRTADKTHCVTIRQERQPREGDDVDPPLYCTDEFRIYYMKVSRCRPVDAAGLMARVSLRQYPRHRETARQQGQRILSIVQACFVGLARIWTVAAPSWRFAACCLALPSGSFGLAA